MGGTLLGPEESGASPKMVRFAGWVWLLVFLWLFGCWIVDASIFVAVLLRSIEPSLVQLLLFWVGVVWVGVLLVCFCCVCVCGDKL